MTRSPERPHLRLVVRETPRRVPAVPTASALEGAQSPEGRALLAARDITPGRSTLISGVPGTGKSSLLLHLIMKDIRGGSGVLVIDPHGDLIEDILARVPLDIVRRRRVVLFDPADLERPPGLNLLVTRTPEEQDKAVQFFLGLLGTLYLVEHQGPILFQAMRNALLLLMGRDRTLVELPRLFTDRTFLREQLAGITDPWVRDYFERVWDGIGEKSRGEYLAYFISKVSHFTDNRVLRNVLGQPRGLDLRAAMRRGDVVLVNLARGKTGDLNTRLLGCIVLNLLERAPLERTYLPARRRTPFHVYVDEFQELAPAGFDTLLGAARKFNVDLTLCLQRFDTLPQSPSETILGTVAHFIQFRQGTVYDGHPMLAALWPRFQAQDLARLPNFEAAARVTLPDGRPRFGRLVVPVPAQADLAHAVCVKRIARRRWPSRTVVEEELYRRLGLTVPGATSSERPCNTGGGRSDVASPERASDVWRVHGAGLLRRRTLASLMMAMAIAGCSGYPMGLTKEQPPSRHNIGRSNTRSRFTSAWASVCPGWEGMEPPSARHLVFLVEQVHDLPEILRRV